jgi:hypothetical protein
MIEKNSPDYRALRQAVSLLESPSITAKIANTIGSPIESAIKFLPNNAQGKIHDLVKTALHKATDAALWSLDNKPQANASNRLHKVLAAASGAIGGAFGFAALAVELPVSTTIMLRSIADIARSEGFDLGELETKQACIEVFALGGPGAGDDASESGYYAIRGFISEATSMLAKDLAGIAAKNAANRLALNPAQLSSWLTAIIEKVATRFGIVITEKFAAQAVPVIGGVAGATLNTLFIDFYQDMARGHFTVKRLEQQYGYEVVKAEYDLIRGRRA